MQICNQSQIPVHAPRIPEGAHVVGPYKGSHECAVSWEVTYDFSIVDTGRRTPELAGTPPPLGPGPGNAQTGRERDEKRQRTEPIDESPGDGGADVAALLRRAAGDIAARLRILARIIARAHLRRQASQSGAVQEPPAEGEDGD